VCWGTVFGKRTNFTPAAVGELLRPPTEGVGGETDSSTDDRTEVRCSIGEAHWGVFEEAEPGIAVNGMASTR